MTKRPKIPLDDIYAILKAVFIGLYVVVITLVFLYAFLNPSVFDENQIIWLQWPMSIATGLIAYLIPGDIIFEIIGVSKKAKSRIKATSGIALFLVVLLLFQNKVKPKEADKAADIVDFYCSEDITSSSKLLEDPCKALTSDSGFSNDYSAWSEFGRVLIEMNRGEHSLIAYDRAISIHPIHYALSGKSRALNYMGRYSDGLDFANKSIEAKRDFPYSHKNRADALYHLDRIQEACESARQAKSLISENLPDIGFSFRYEEKCN